MLEIHQERLGIHARGKDWFNTVVPLGRARYKQDFASGKVGRTVYIRSGRNLPPHRHRRVFDRDEVLRLQRQGWSYRQIAKYMGLGLGTFVRTLRLCSKSS